MSRTSALTRKPKGLGRRNFAQGTPGHMRLLQRLQGQKVKSQGQQGRGILWRPPSRTACCVSNRLSLVWLRGVACRDQLLYAYDAVVHVDVLDSHDAANLKLLGRPELGPTFTKLQCWRLTQYTKCVFLDADTLVSSIRIMHVTDRQTDTQTHTQRWWAVSLTSVTLHYWPVSLSFSPTLSRLYRQALRRLMSSQVR